jgi:hypothetical protein
MGSRTHPPHGYQRYFTVPNVAFLLGYTNTSALLNKLEASEVSGRRLKAESNDRDSTANRRPIVPQDIYVILPAGSGKRKLRRFLPEPTMAWIREVNRAGGVDLAEEP